MTTLTREALLNKGKLRYKVIAVPGVGDVGIRSVSELKQSKRDSRFYDPATGKPNDDLFEKSRAFSIIDQVMLDESTPMFSEADLDEILSMDKAITRRLFAAIQEFNGEDGAEKKGEAAESDG